MMQTKKSPRDGRGQMSGREYWKMVRARQQENTRKVVEVGACPKCGGTVAALAPGWYRCGSGTCHWQGFTKSTPTS